MKEKLFAICVVGFLMLTFFPSAVGIKIEKLEIKSNNEIEFASITDELDQYQNDTEGYPLAVGRFPGYNTSIQVAQSFKPNKEVLTRVELYIGKNTTASEPFELAIRKSLKGENLAEIQVNTSVIVETDFSWIEFNFKDFVVNINQTYYIICFTKNITENWFLWGTNNNSESYIGGCAWYSIDDGASWSNHSRSKDIDSKSRNLAIQSDGNNESDMCFKTHGRDVTNLKIELNTFGEGLTTIFSNIGSINTTGFYFKITINGGFLGFINETNEAEYCSQLSPNKSISINTSFFGFGLVDIDVITYATNARQVEKLNIRGFVFLTYILILPN